MHTRGNWFYRSGPALKGRYHAVHADVGAEDFVMVCECYDGDETEQEANARLIAAAPDLYEALEAVCAQLVVQMEWNDNHNVAIRESAEYLGDTSLAREALAEAKAALSKASQQQGSPQATLSGDK